MFDCHKRIYLKQTNLQVVIKLCPKYHPFQFKKYSQQEIAHHDTEFSEKY